MLNSRMEAQFEDGSSISNGYRKMPSKTYRDKARQVADQEDETLSKLFYFLYNNEGKNMNTRSINKKMRYLGGLTAFLGFGLVANPASADLLWATQNNTEQNGSGANTLDLNGAANGKQAFVTFTTVQPNTWVRVIFNASAAVRGNFQATLNATIFIDPAGQQGQTECSILTNEDDEVAEDDASDAAFVSGNGTPNVLDGWVSAVKQCVYRVPTAGVHRVSVRVTPSPSNQWQIDDLSLVVDR
jgi:hypothetical protein